jgi:hypothetical protein
LALQWEPPLALLMEGQDIMFAMDVVAGWRTVLTYEFCAHWPLLITAFQLAVCVESTSPRHAMSCYVRRRKKRKKGRKKERKDSTRRWARMGQDGTG